jgi:hypothetical protein
MAWTDLTKAAVGVRPSARVRHGFTAAGGRLYLFGGLGPTGEVCVVCGAGMNVWRDGWWMVGYSEVVHG